MLSCHHVPYVLGIASGQIYDHADGSGCLVVNQDQFIAPARSLSEDRDRDDARDHETHCKNGSESLRVESH